MMIRYQDLVTFQMLASDGLSHQIEDILISDRDLRIAYVVVDIGSWHSGRKAMVGIERFGAPEVDATRWPAEIDETALEDKPEPAAGSDAAGQQGRRSRLGPVGALVSRRLLHAGDEAGPIPAQGDPRAAAPESGGLRSVGEWILDTDVRAEDGPAGKLIGVIFAIGAWKARDIIVETGGEGLPETQRVVPVGLVSGIEWDGRSVQLAASVQRVHESPDLHQVDDLAGKWYNKVLAYYGLQS